MQTQPKVLITSTFNSGIFAEALQWWLAQLRVKLMINVMPYGQVFQNLLDDTGEPATNRQGLNIIMVRWEDWIFSRDADADTIRTDLMESVSVLIDRIKVLDAAGILCLICLCPASDETRLNAPLMRILEETDRSILSMTSPLNLALCIDLVTECARFNMDRPNDSYAEQVGHIPYSPLFFSLAATCVARRIAWLFTSPFKVLVVDCDNTLWRGECGETPEDLVIDDCCTALQILIAGKIEEGFLLCLCSKNDEEVAWGTFTTLRGMHLSPAQVTARQINWRPKSQNLMLLSQDLNLAPDSFIFIDDDAGECYEVQKAYPEMLVLQTPKSVDEVEMLGRNLWALDRFRITVEDKQRSIRYREEIQRKEASRTLSHFEFLNSLDISIDIVNPGEQDKGRLLQLIRRTRQFNTTDGLSGVSDLLTAEQEPSSYAWSILTRDRFGDYGLVGITWGSFLAQDLVVNGLILSCRALGKHMEDTILYKLAELAQVRSATNISIPFYQTDRNRMAYQFLQQIGFEVTQTHDSRCVFTCLVATLMDSAHFERLGYGVAYRKQFGDTLDHTQTSLQKPVEGIRSGHTSPAVVEEDTPLSAREQRNALLLKIALRDNLPAWVLENLISERNVDVRPVAKVTPPQTETERRLLAIWKQRIGLQAIGIDNDLFDVVADSLIAIEILTRVREEFGIEVPLSILFSNAFTICELAKFIDIETIKRQDPDVLSAALAELDALSEEEISRLLEDE